MYDDGSTLLRATIDIAVLVVLLCFYCISGSSKDLGMLLLSFEGIKILRRN